MRVAVTGGTGVVGTAVTRHLLTAGHQVRALARNSLAADDLTSLGATPVPGDVSDNESLDRLVAGCEWVFHVAGVNQLCSIDPELMERVNVEGSRAVLGACRRAGVTRLVHTSSAVTIGEPEGETGTESTIHRGYHLSHYERTKAESESVVLAGADDLEVVVVNPSSVQGPGRATGTGRLLLEAARGRMPVMVDTAFSLVDIDDCARGHLLAAESGQPGERYILSGATMTTREALGVLSLITGRPSRARFLRPSVFAAMGTTIGGVWSLTGRQAPLCREAVKVMLHGHRYDGSRATADLGLVYTPIEETLSRTFEWFSTEGLLDQ